MPVPSSIKAARKRIPSRYDIRSVSGFERNNAAFLLTAAGDYRRGNSHKITPRNMARLVDGHAVRMEYARFARISAIAEGFELP